MKEKKSIIAKNCNQQKKIIYLSNEEKELISKLDNIIEKLSQNLNKNKQNTKSMLYIYTIINNHI